MFKLEQQRVIVTGVNLRTEAAGENKRANLGTDVKCTAENIDAAILLELQPADANADLDIVKALFTKGGAPRWNSISGYDFEAEYENCEAVIAGQEFGAAKVSGFRLLRCRDAGKIDLQFRVQIHPTGDQAGVLSAQLTKESSELTVNQSQQELDV